MAAKQPPLMQDTITLSFCTPLYHSLSQGVLSLVTVMNGWSFTQKGHTVVATSLIQTPAAFVFGIDVAARVQPLMQFPGKARKAQQQLNIVAAQGGEPCAGKTSINRLKHVKQIFVHISLTLGTALVTQHCMPNRNGNSHLES